MTYPSSSAEEVNEQNNSILSENFGYESERRRLALVLRRLS